MINTIRFTEDLKRLREQHPLVHCVTNYVAMNYTANALLALGVSPVMAHAADEVEDMSSIAQSLLLNIGTPDASWVASMLQAGHTMHALGHPIVLDPVGAGATPYRTQTAWSIIRQCHPTIIRGNASEIVALDGHTISTKGVDTTIDSADALDCAVHLARQTDSVVVVSGATDYITDGDKMEQVTYGSPLQTRVTAMGCTISAIVAAMAAINADALEAAVHAMTLAGLAGEHAAARCQGIGSMAVAWIDELDQISHEGI